MQRLCFLVTSPIGLRAFLLPHIEKLSHEYQVSVCVGSGDGDVEKLLPDNVDFKVITIHREIRPLADIASLFALFRFYRRGRFDLVYTLSPKAGLLGMLAAWLARVPHRVHCFTGQIWATRTGPVRSLLKMLDRILAIFATHLLADSHSQRQFLIDQGVADPHRIQVLGDGSMAGVDTQKFRPDQIARDRLRAQLGMDAYACCLLYVGRLKRDKGVLDLVAAFDHLYPNHPNLHLLLVGPDEEGLESLITGRPRLHRVGYSAVVEQYMAAADIFCLPSYREGFGQVLIEAGATGLAVIASRIYGITDAVVEGQTGLLHLPGDVTDLCRQINCLIDDATTRASFGQAGRARALSRFNMETVTGAMADFFRVLLSTPKR